MTVVGAGRGRQDPVGGGDGQPGWRAGSRAGYTCATCRPRPTRAWWRRRSARPSASAIRSLPTERQEVAKLLRERPALLVLDSCEHLMGGVAAAVDTLLALSPALRVLATSREPLGVEGEHLWRLGSLEVPAADGDLETIRRSDAVVLFEGRARLVQPGIRRH